MQQEIKYDTVHLYDKTIKAYFCDIKGVRYMDKFNVEDLIKCIKKHTGLNAIWKKPLNSL